MRSTVLAPIEPVAPSSVSERSPFDDGFGAARTTSVFIVLPHQQSAARHLEAAPQQSDQRGHDTCRDEAIEPVHQPAVTGDKVARILGAEPALEKGFEEVAG